VLEPDLGQRLKRQRGRARLSLAELAQSTGISKAYLVRLESDPVANPSLDILRRIALALDTTVADLVGAPSLQFAAEDAAIPASLRAFADDVGLPSRELQTLASIRWRKGEEPKTAARWRYVLDSLRASRSLDADRD
jgi:transcriptional regulator with XRE-family HTH domain